MVVILLAACDPIDLPQEWELDRNRLLAVRAEPAEPRPGDTVAFTSLAYVPEGAEASTFWWSCLDGNDYGCPIPERAFELLEALPTLSPEEQAAALAELQALGFTGATPGLEPVWMVPATALDALSEAERLEGISATVAITQVVGEDTEIVTRRVPVSLAVTPNHNPDVARITVDGVDVAATVPATAGETYDLAAILAPGAIELYQYTTTDGAVERRTEEPSWRWYVEAGELVRDPRLGDDETPEQDDIHWTAPDEPREVLVHAVVLDGRGGMGWLSTRFAVE